MKFCIFLFTKIAYFISILVLLMLHLIAMSILAENLRYLRGRLQRSQQKVAEDLMITRGRYAKYEDSATEPPIEILIRMAQYFQVSIDPLLTQDISRISKQAPP